MIKSLNEANKSTEQAQKYYDRYIREAMNKYGNIKICEMIGRYDKYLFKVLDEGSLSQKRRVANQIADTMSANEGTNKL